MNLVKPHLPKITQDLSFEFEADYPHPCITHDIEFDITLEKLEENRRGTASATALAAAPRRIAMQLGRRETMGALLTRGAESVASVLGFSNPARLIQKPLGEPGRPGSGGFNVEDALKWDEEIYNNFESFVHNQCDKFLDNTKTWSRQDRNTVKVILNSAKEKFPILSDYEDDWPTKSLIKLRLKTKAESARKQDAAMEKAIAALTAGKRRAPGRGGTVVVDRA